VIESDDCQTQLAVLDHNAGVDLQQSKTEKGIPHYKLVFPKQSAQVGETDQRAQEQGLHEWLQESSNVLTVKLN